MQLSNTVKMYLPQQFIDKVKYLCRSIAKIEWSGILFYTIEGSIKKPDSMKITLNDILLMDKGTATYTSFDWDEDVVNYRMDNPELIDSMIGHIHSHNTMSVFFSGTDWSELNDNCPQHNFYLSVIVNNYLDVTAKIAFTAAGQTFTCKDENGRDYKLSLTNSDLQPVMLVYDCEPILPEVQIQVPRDFANRLEIVDKKLEAIKAKAEEERKARVAAAAKTTVKNPMVKGDFNQGSFMKKSGNKTPDYNPNDKESQKLLNYELAKELGEDYDDDDEVQTTEHIFAAYVIRLGNDVEDDEIEDALNDLETADLNSASIASSIMQSYGPFYDGFFEKHPKYHGDKAFMETLERVIEIYEEHEKNYPLLIPIIHGLKELGIKFENFVKDGVEQ